MKRICFSITVFLLFTICNTQIYSQETAVSILRKVEQQMRGESSYIEMTMTTIRPRFTREISMKTWSKGQDYSLILITSPARDKGAAYLKRGNEIWNYSPNIDRMIKMPPSMMSQSWMGSDFSNDDLVRESSIIEDYAHRILREEVYQGRQCWVLELIPKPESTIVFGKVLIWVAKDLYVQMQIQNFDERNRLVSTILFSEIKNLGGSMLPAVLEMIPADKSNHKTIIRYNSAQFNIPIDEQFFSVQNLKNVK